MMTQLAGIDAVMAEIEALPTHGERVRALEAWLATQPEEVQILQGPDLMSGLALLYDEDPEVSTS